MSTPINQQPPPMADAVTQQAYRTHSGHGSVGPVIAVLALITVLGVIAGMIGRTLINPPPPPPPAVEEAINAGEDVSAAAPVETQQEIKEEGQAKPNSLEKSSLS
ncbi:Alpha-protein kinase 1-like [Quillaja saponaria]|uniref:Alpha-protein kinase 1-like n=1 Tax=Quillaja saponaria TaxID=32244 RepID=A0AAD7KUI6_QUISA|nr:Alpha-protein kinase 1-like [Quillaja saponaria]